MRPAMPSAFLIYFFIEFKKGELVFANLEVILSYSAQWAYPILWNILECCSWCNT